MRFLRRGEGQDAQAVARIAEENGVLPLLASALYHRGLCAREDVQAFLHPSMEQLHDPFLLPDMRAAVERIAHALREGERICVYGDYDADGVCATAILLGFLEKQGADCRCHIPSRHQHGYGMHPDTVRLLHEDGVRLIITVDNGISAREEVALCAQLGIDVIITDHHQCPEALPECIAVVDAHRPDSTYPFKELCGAGVAWKLVQALGGDAEEYLSLAALATVADIVPLLGENRVLVALGLKDIGAHTGMMELLRVSGTGTDNVTSETLAFRLAPRINAAGRMAEADRALRLLMTKDAEVAHALAISLDEENAARQREEKRILRAAEAMLKEEDTAALPAILLYGEDWNPGVIGIVASKLAERYYRPVLLFHLQEGLLTGSCRSIPGVHLFRCLDACKGRLVRYGGHAQAAGLTLALEEFPAFCEEFQAYVRKNTGAEAFIRTAHYEIEAELKDISANAVEALSLLAPHGEGNPRPVFRTRGVTLSDRQRMGSTGAHLRAQANKGGARLPLVAFGRGDKERAWAGRMDLLYVAEINSWMGQRRLQLQLREARVETMFDDARELTSNEGKFYDAFFHNVLYNVNRTQLRLLPNLDVELVGALKEELHGVLILCFTPDGARALRELLLQEGLHERVRVCYGELPVGAAAPHTLLLAPRLARLCCERYRQVYLYDLGELRALISPPESAEGRPVFASERGNALLAPLRVSREEMASVYRGFLRVLDGKEKPRAQLLQGDYARKTLALLVFLELGFLKWNGEADTIVFIESAVKRSLQESRLYVLANM